MTERPIIFNGEMVRAILDGRKTQTRRVIKPQPPYDKFIHLGAGALGMWSGWPEDPKAPIWEAYCPYGKPGDQLWVRETFCPVDDREMGGEVWIDYRATPKYGEDEPAGWEKGSDDPEAAKWSPSIHMPRKASRIQLEVVKVRVERLQDITREDALAEGVRKLYRMPHWGYAEPIESFMICWDMINTKRNFEWDANPWVWVVEFQLLEVKGGNKN